MVDWNPTLLNLAGASVEQKLPLDGKDLWGTLTEGKGSPHEEILINAEPTRGAVRVGDWKLVLGGARNTANADLGQGGARRQGRRGGVGAEVELFNLKEDPGEKTNLAEKEPDRVKELRERYETYARAAVGPKNREGAEE
jgi:arylsulfatase A-like enzyme